MADAGPEEDARTEADEAPPAPRAKFDPGAALEKLADTRRVRALSFHSANSSKALTLQAAELYHNSGLPG